MMKKNLIHAGTTVYETWFDLTVNSGYNNFNRDNNNKQVFNSSFACVWLTGMNYVSILLYKIQTRNLFIAS